jgi:hypothetical protein
MEEAPPRPAFEVPPAQAHFNVPADKVMHSMNAGAIIVRTGQLKSKYRVAGRVFAQGMAEYVTEEMNGLASCAFYDEALGTQDRITWLIHLRQLSDYQEVMAQSARPEAFLHLLEAMRKGGHSTDATTWDEMFVDGSFRERVIIPYFPGFGGTNQSES